jgi:hypothetical protein
MWGNIVWHFKPWKLAVIRFAGTERQNCDYLVGFIRDNKIKPISYSCTQVEKRFIGVLIYKTKFVADEQRHTA